MNCFTNSLQRIKIDVGYRIDMLVESVIIVENKTVDDYCQSIKAQLLTYLKLSVNKLSVFFSIGIQV